MCAQQPFMRECMCGVRYFTPKMKPFSGHCVIEIMSISFTPAKVRILDGIRNVFNVKIAAGAEHTMYFNAFCALFSLVGGPARHRLEKGNGFALCGWGRLAVNGRMAVWRGECMDRGFAPGILFRPACWFFDTLCRFFCSRWKMEAKGRNAPFSAKRRKKGLGGNAWGAVVALSRKRPGEGTAGSGAEKRGWECRGLCLGNGKGGHTLQVCPPD